MDVFVFQSKRGGRGESQAAGWNGNGRFDTHDTSHARNDLGEDRWRHGFGVGARMAVYPQMVDDDFASRDVTTRSTE